MKISFYIISLFIVCHTSSFSQSNMGFGHFKPEYNIPCLSPERHQEIERQLQIIRQNLQASDKLLLHHDRSARTSFIWPITANNGLPDFGYHGISNFVDQDQDAPDALLDYNCGARTYDLPSGYNHGGTDIYLWPFAWYKMEHDQVKVVAAADGVILDKSDGNFDQSCSFNNNNWNAVYVQHADGSVAWYGHLKNGSVTTKNTGDSVFAGEYLGIVGSSGSSSGPHLHFEIYDAGAQLIDPYAGDCNELNSASWWADQRPYYDSGLNALITHSDPPVFPTCPESEIINDENQFCAGQRAYFASYFRDQQEGQQVYYKVLRPNGTVFQEWTQTFSEFYTSSYWYWYYTLPVTSFTGIWTFQATYMGEKFTKYFDVNGLTVISYTGDGFICEGSSAILSVPGSSYDFNYQWKRNGENLPGANSHEYEATESGNYSCAVIIPGGCSTNSNSVMLQVRPNPIIDLGDDIILVSADTLLDAGPNWDSYIWTTVETSQNIHVSGMGIYSVTVTDEFGCTASDEIEILESSSTSEDSFLDDIFIFPNPVSKTLQVKSYARSLGSLQLYDPAGRLIFVEQTSDDLYTMDLTALDPGLYYLQIGGNNNRKIFPVIRM